LKVQIKNDRQLLKYANIVLGFKEVNNILNNGIEIRIKEEKQNPVSSGGNKFKNIVDFVTRNYDLRRNLVSKDVEISVKNYELYTNFNIEDIECKLYENNFTSFDRMLKSIAGSKKYVREFNPLESYLDSIKDWNYDKPDWIRKLSEFVKTDDDAWFKIHFKKMLVRSLACSLGYIPFNKQVFCLVGKDQNLGKSSFLRFVKSFLNQRQ